MTAEFEFSSAELTLLAAACRQADDIAELEAALRGGFIVPGSTGQPRLSAAVAEVRLGRLALARLIAELRLPSDGEHAGVNRTKQRAAESRWGAHRRRLAALGDGA